jgi:hypothetical protein
MSHRARAHASRVAFIGVQVELQAKVGRDPHDDIAKDQGAAPGVDRDLDHFMVPNIQPHGIRGAHVNVAQRAYHARGKHHSSPRTFQCDSWSSRQITGQAQRWLEPEHTRIGLRDLDLIGTPRRTQHAHVLQAATRPDQADRIER